MWRLTLLLAVSMLLSTSVNANPEPASLRMTLTRPDGAVTFYAITPTKIELRSRDSNLNLNRKDCPRLCRDFQSEAASICLGLHRIPASLDPEMETFRIRCNEREFQVSPASLAATRARHLLPQATLIATHPESACKK